ncbi:MAG: protein-L-isoaspartate O-methyltransferase, partial [Chlorobiales bacterium]|nr:protein-L-isoaspartate O-methyltransferase [Chlorobiales bacterium]
KAQKALDDLGLDNVRLHVGDGSRGWPEAAPYDAIMATAAAPSVPEPLLEQLGPEAVLVMPVGRAGQQVLQRWRREGESCAREDFSPVAFVPLIGEFGWDA